LVLQEREKNYFERKKEIILIKIMNKNYRKSKRIRL